ncbi:hypothetical protein BU26DRAFT_298621 [Trematosphaeria pertusa]|uniref:Uncharacterized protein n=1 Tax=Trematosphaeria pertusa TaxID=390896 RepID=A0A6A6II61_9PLEO|nr:uncharacterized protein BU26DRAFT_298621 [Trematosphaeria pertusa]KAF2250264.1 hypothetical protein BU26DRAFT_298621 [Trematosphaeria pertusa]
MTTSEVPLPKTMEAATTANGAKTTEAPPEQPAYMQLLGNKIVVNKTERPPLLLTDNTAKVLAHTLPIRHLEEQRLNTLSRKIAFGVDTKDVAAVVTRFISGRCSRMATAPR